MSGMAIEESDNPDLQLSTESRVQISDVVISGLEKARFGQRYIVITVNRNHKLDSISQKSKSNLRWDQTFEFTAASPSTTVEIAVFHKIPAWNRVECIGSFTATVGDIGKGASHTLTKSGVSAGTLVCKLLHTFGPTVSGAEATISSAVTQLQVSSSQSDRISDLQQRVTSAYSTASAMSTSAAPIGEALQSLEQLMKVFEGIADISAISKVAWRLLSSVYKSLARQYQQDSLVLALCISIRDMIVFARGVRNLRQLEGGIDIIREMFLGIELGASLIEEYLESSFLARAVKGAVWDKISVRIEECRSRLSYLYQQLDIALGVQALNTLDQLHVDTVEKAKRELLDRLPVVPEVEFDWVKDQCSEGTRKEILVDLLQWATATSPDDPPIFWLDGLAGTGKSTIAATFAQLLFDKEYLGGSFFFSRTVAERSTSRHVFTTLALQLATRIPRLAERICNAVHDDRGVGKSAVSTQWRTVIRGPLATAQGLQLPIVLVLDALDECTPSLDILSNIATDISNLPTFFKILVTSRPEPELIAAFDSMGMCVRRCHLSSATPTINRDIGIFISEQMKDISRLYGLSEDWPGPSRREDLVSKAAGSFIWAATAMKFIRGGGAYGPPEQLDLLLNGGNIASAASMPWADLDALYLQVLTRAFSQTVDKRQLDLYRAVIGAIVTIRDPLNAIALAALLDIQGRYDNPPHKIVLWAVRNLQSVLAVPEDAAEPLQTIHPSFIDFLTNQSRCSDERFFIDTGIHHHFLLKRSLQIMHQLLRTNIIDADPALFNSEVSDIEHRISLGIAEHLRYASCYWADHLHPTEPDVEIITLLRTFYHEDLLNWIELLSVTKAVDAGFRGLKIAHEWLQAYHVEEDNLQTIAYDALRFLQEFRVPITLSSMQVHHSALPLSPSRTMLYKTYFPKLKADTIKILMGAPETWTPCLAVLEGHHSFVHAASFSPDGVHVVSGSQDKSVRIWDPNLGVGEVLEGHEDIVSAVAFSPDGKTIASGSYDKTIRIWNVASGKPKGSVLKGHEDRIRCVAFSPNGELIASGSYDMTIRLWDGVEGTTLGKVLKGHADVVASLAFSPDNRSIVSGSWDQTVRLWDVESCTLIKAFPGQHTSHIYAVAFSPDGKRVISGSYDQTIRLWDVESGGTVGDPWVGHKHAVSSLAFSPHRNIVVSGSWDSTVQFWDSDTGLPIGDALHGHTGPVFSVAFSSDGKYVVSGSNDYTVRLWDVVSGTAQSTSTNDAKMAGAPKDVWSVAFSPDARQLVSGSRDGSLTFWDPVTAEPVGSAQKGHNDVLTTLVFSSDGKFIATGSVDSTIRIWDAVTRTPIGEPLTGHNNRVWCIAFSRDSKRIVSGSRDRTIRLWDLASGSAVGEPFKGHPGTVHCVAFSPDEAEIVSGSADGTLRYWNSLSGELIGTPVQGHSDMVVSVAYTADGKYVVSASADGVSVVWDAQTRIQCPIPPTLTGGPWFPLDVSFDKKSGWVRDMQGKRVGWLPSEYRATPRVTKDGRVPTPGRGKITILDFSRVVKRE